ncbi:MAG: cytosine deaminase [Acuticoccus sp.]
MKLVNAAIPTTFLATPAAGEFARMDVTCEAGRIALVEPARGEGGDVDCGGGLVVPAFVDMHTHLDQGHIWPRAQNPDGSFGGALSAVEADRDAHWQAHDVKARFAFALRTAYAHGTAALRTHISTTSRQIGISWPVFAELKAEWADRLTLQGSSLTAIDDIAEEPGPLFDTVTRHGGMVGAFLYRTAGLREGISHLLSAAEDRGLDIDLHVDEIHDPASDILGDVATIARNIGFSGTITCGHCCSLMVMEEKKALEILDEVALAGLAIVSLPMCNQYLMARDPAARRTPRVRGGTLVHEMAARGIPVAFASDNTRDPFYAYGDLDMVEVWREATRILHLDHPVADWPRAFSTTPAAIMGLPDRDAIGPGAPADLVVFTARDWTELMSRPQSDRRVIRDGALIDATPPAYDELDPLFFSPAP